MSITEDSIRTEAHQLLVELFRRHEHNCVPNELDLALVGAIISSKVAEMEKAYGGCRKCYGKGYATVIEYVSGFDSDGDIGSHRGAIKYKKPVMRFCTCDRGKQLATLVPTREDDADAV